MSNVVVEFHESARPQAPVHVIANADAVLIAHTDGSVTCCKDRNVNYKRRARNQIPQGHLFAVEDAEASNDDGA